MQLLQRFSRLFVWWTVIQPWEAAIRVRLGKNMVNIGPGVHWAIPYIHKVYRQSIRTRMVSLSTQTLTTKDGKTITLSGAFSYRITDLVLLYNTLHHAEGTLIFMAMSKIAEVVHSRNLESCGPSDIERAVAPAMDLKEFGLAGESLRIIDYAVVKTYRLITDQRYSHGGDTLITTQADAAPAPGSATSPF